MTVLFAVLLAGVSAERELIDRIAAVVNDEIILMSEVEAAAKPFMEFNTTDDKKKALYKDVLEQLVSERLLSQEVKEAKIEVTEDEVDRALKDILKRNKITLEQLQQAIKANGISMGQYRENVKSDLVRLKIIDLKVRSRVVISEGEVKAEYDRRVAGEKKQRLVHIRHLLFRWGESPDPDERQNVLKRARAARQRVLNGEDFAKVAKEVSDGPTATNGGDLGEIQESGLLPELARGLVGVKKGAVTPPIETSGGVHVVEVLDRKMKQPTEYKAVHDEIYQKLYTKEVERQMKVWIDELKGSSAIDLRL